MTFYLIAGFMWMLHAAFFVLAAVLLDPVILVLALLLTPFSIGLALDARR